MDNCIINFSNGLWYPKGGKRLAESLKSISYEYDLIQIEKYPQGCPTHQQVPYAFKFHMFMDAKNKGYKNVLWVDSSFWAIKNIEEVFDHIKTNGWLFENSDNNVGTWSTDKSLAGFNISREEAFKLPMFSGGFIGLNFENSKANEFLKQTIAKTKDGFSFIGAWRNSNLEVSSDPRVQGHRHDMVVGSIISNNLGMNILPLYTFWTHRGWYTKYKNDPNYNTSKICFLAEGM